MSYQSFYTERAYKELTASWQWYEAQQLFLGDKFKDAVDKKIAVIERSPKLFPNRIKNFREARIDKFPYLIIFSIIEAEKKIIILSVFHTKRSPVKKYK